MTSREQNAPPTRGSAHPAGDLRTALCWGAAAGLSVALLFPYMLAVWPARFAAIRVPLRVLVPAQALQGALVGFGLAWLGLRLGRAVGLDSPIVRGLAAGRGWPTGAGRTLAVAAVAGLGVGLLLAGLDRTVLALGDPGPGADRWKGLLASFYGGVTEEVITRLFLMTLVLRLLTALRGDARSTAVGLAAVAIAAAAFAAAHLPAAGMLAPLTARGVTRVMVLNSLGGLVFGWLYWRHGFEHAVAAHFCADVMLHAVFA